MSFNDPCAATGLIYMTNHTTSSKLAFSIVIFFISICFNLSLLAHVGPRSFFMSDPHHKFDPVAPKPSKWGIPNLFLAVQHQPLLPLILVELIRPDEDSLYFTMVCTPPQKSHDTHCNYLWPLSLRRNGCFIGGVSSNRLLFEKSAGHRRLLHVGRARDPVPNQSIAGLLFSPCPLIICS